MLGLDADLGGAGLPEQPFSPAFLYRTIPTVSRENKQAGVLPPLRRGWVVLRLPADFSVSLSIASTTNQPITNQQA